MIDEPIRLLGPQDLEDFRATKRPNLFELRLMDSLCVAWAEIERLELERESLRDDIASLKAENAKLRSRLDTITIPIPNAAMVEVERLTDQLDETSWRMAMYKRLYDAADKPESCGICCKPATCIGWSLDGGVAPMCDECCGHGNEDSECHPVPPTRAEIERLEASLCDARHGTELADSETAGRDQEIEHLKQTVALADLDRRRNGERLAGNAATIHRLRGEVERLEALCRELWLARRRMAYGPSSEAVMLQRHPFLAAEAAGGE